MVRLVLADGQHMGIVELEQAMQQAQESDLDLVEIAPEADPPVCKLLDYGKFKYREKKKLRQKHHKSQVKEIRVGLETQEHDLQFKAKHARDFLGEHHKVLVTMMLKGRQKAHADMAKEHMSAFAQRFEDVAKLERPPTRESAGRLSMLLTPR